MSNPRDVKLAGSVHLGGITRKTAAANGEAFEGGPQMLEISRDGKRVYFTNSLYSTWDDQFYPDGMSGATVMVNVDHNGGMALDEKFCLKFPDGYRSHQIRLEGGDCSTGSFCYPSV